MARWQGINVEIRSGGVPLQCYDDPDQATNRNSGEVRKYIEAVTDAKFAVAYELTKDFKMGDCDGAKARYILDGRSVTTNFVEKRTFHERGYSFKMVCGSNREFSASSREWRRAEWSFGKLNIRQYCSC